MSLRYRRFGPSSPYAVGAPVAVNALGFDAHQTWALWRAQVSAFGESPFVCRNGERATMALDRTLPPRAGGAERVAKMTERALSQFAPTLARLRGLTPCVALSLPDEAWCPHTRPLSRAVTHAALTFLSEQGFHGVLESHPRGHAGLADALLGAIGALEAGAAGFAIVGGCDTYHDPALVEQLLREGRLFDLKNHDSMTPGEGAAFFLVGPAHVLRRAGVDVDARVESVALAEEPAPMLQRDHWPSTARGLTHAMKTLTWYLKQERRRLDWIVGDMTHESYRVHEFQLAFPRALAPGGLDDAGASFAEVAGDPIHVDFVPERFGDLGAASMATGAVLALEAFRRGAPEAATCLLYGSTPTGHRGGVLLSRASGAADEGRAGRMTS